MNQLQPINLSMEMLSELKFLKHKYYSTSLQLHIFP